MTDVRSNVHVLPLVNLEPATSDHTDAQPSRNLPTLAPVRAAAAGARAFAAAATSAARKTTALTSYDRASKCTVLRTQAIAANPKSGGVLRLGIPVLGGALAATGAVAVGLFAWPLVIAVGAGVALTAAATEGGYRAMRRASIKKSEDLLLESAGSAARAIVEAQRDSVRDATEPTYASATIVAGAEDILAQLTGSSDQKSGRAVGLGEHRALFEEIVALGHTIPGPMLATARRTVALEAAVSDVSQALAQRYMPADAVELLANAVDALPPEELATAAADVLKRLFPEGAIANDDSDSIGLNEIYTHLRQITGEKRVGTAAQKTFDAPARPSPTAAVSRPRSSLPRPWLTPIPTISSISTLSIAWPRTQRRRGSVRSSGQRSRSSPANLSRHGSATNRATTMPRRRWHR